MNYYEKQQNKSQNYKYEDLLSIDKKLPSNLIESSNNSNMISKESKDNPDSLPNDIMHLLNNFSEQKQKNNNNNTIQLHNKQTIKHSSNNLSNILDHSSSFSFSIKNENVAHDNNSNNLLNNNLDISSISSDVNNNKVIVYNISDEFLIQMTIVNQTTDPNFIKLQYHYKNEDIVINKNDIFYQSIDSFDTFGNFPQMKIINELSVLKNIQMRLINNKPFFYIGDILVLVNSEDFKGNRYFFIEEFIKYLSINPTNALIYKQFHIQEKNIFFTNNNNNNEISFLSRYLYINKASSYIKYNSLFDKVFQLFNCANITTSNDAAIEQEIIIDNNNNKSNSSNQNDYMKQRYLISFHFNSNNYFNYIPILSPNSSNNDLYAKSIIFQSNTKKYNVLLNPEINIHLTYLYLNNTNNNIKNSFISKTLLVTFLSFPHNIQILNLIYEIFSMANITKHFVNVVKLLLLASIAYQPKKIFPCENQNLNKSLKINQNVIKEVNKSNMIYYSNILILVLFKYINSLLSVQFANNKNEKSKAINDIVIFSNDSNKDDDIILNEVIKQRVECGLTNSKHKNSISKCVLLYLSENVTKFNQSLNKYDHMFIDMLENNIFDINFIKRLYNGTNIVTIMKNAYTLSIQNFTKFETSVDNFHQIWACEIGENYEMFFSSQEKIIEFLQLTQIIEYCMMYHNIYKEVNGNNYFRNYPFEYFFKAYLPILTDIDTRYNKKKIAKYSKSLYNFINDIQHFQAINEPFLINDTKIGILHKTFEILNLLLKSILDEKAKNIQKNYRRFIIHKLISTLRKKTIVIQKHYRMLIYREILKKNQNKDNYLMICNTIIDKYKCKDPLIIRYVINMRKKYNELYNENKTLNEYYQSELNIINSNSNSDRQMVTAKSTNNIIIDNEDEIAELTKKLNENRTKFKNLVMIIAEYEKKMENFVKMINANKEVKEILFKNGITIN